VLDLEEAQDPDDVGMTQLEDKLDLLSRLLRLELPEELDRDGLPLVLSFVDVG